MQFFPFIKACPNVFSTIEQALNVSISAQLRSGQEDGKKGRVDGEGEQEGARMNDTPKLAPTNDDFITLSQVPVGRQRLPPPPTSTPSNSPSIATRYPGLL